MDTNGCLINGSNRQHDSGSHNVRSLDIYPCFCSSVIVEFFHHDSSQLRPGSPWNWTKFDVDRAAEAKHQRQQRGGEYFDGRAVSTDHQGSVSPQQGKK